MQNMLQERSYAAEATSECVVGREPLKQYFMTLASATAQELYAQIRCSARYVWMRKPAYEYSLLA